MCRHAWIEFLQDGLVGKGGNFETFRTAVIQKNDAAFNRPVADYGEYCPDVESNAGSFSHRVFKSTVHDSLPDLPNRLPICFANN